LRAAALLALFLAALAAG